MSALDPFVFAGEEIDIADKEARELAAIEFDAIEPGELAKIMAALSGQEWSETTRIMGFELRVAAVIVGKSKPELVECARRLLAEAGENEDEDACISLLDRLISAEQHLESLQRLLSAAYARLMGAASVVAIEGEPE